MLPSACQWSGVALMSTFTLRVVEDAAEVLPHAGARPCAASTALTRRIEPARVGVAQPDDFRVLCAWQRPGPEYEPRPPTPITPMRIFSFGEAALPSGRTLKVAEAATEVLTNVRRVMVFIISCGF